MKSQQGSPLITIAEKITIPFVTKGARSLNKQLKSKRPTFDIDLKSKKPDYVQDMMEKAIDKQMGVDVVHERDLPVRLGMSNVIVRQILSNVDDTPLIDITPYQKAKYTVINDRRYSTLLYERMLKEKILKNTSLRYRWEKTYNDLKRIDAELKEIDKAADSSDILGNVIHQMDRNINPGKRFKER